MKQQIVLVSGKGGVGKSTVAAALALKEARKGQSVLLVELGESSYLSSVFGLSPSYSPQKVSSGLDLSRWGGDSCLKEFLTHYLRVHKLVDLFFENRVMRTFVRAAPGLNELAILGKLTSGLRKIGPPLNYDVIVVDAFATGHFRALLRVPYAMAQVVRFGPMGEQCRSIDAVLKDTRLCRMVIVTLLEELPVTETIELNSDLKEEWGQQAQILANKCHHWPIDRQDLESLAADQFNEGSVPNSLSEFATHVLAENDRQQKGREKLEKAGLVWSELPFVYKSKARQVIEQLAKAMEAL